MNQRSRENGAPATGLSRGREHRVPSPALGRQELSPEGAGAQIAGLLPDELIVAEDNGAEPRGQPPPTENAHRRQQRQPPPQDPDPDPEPQAADDGSGANQPPPDDGEAGEESTLPWEYLSDFAEAAEIPVEMLLGMKHRFKSAGEQKEATIADVISGFQKGDDYQRKTEGIAELTRQVEANERARHEAFIQASKGIAEQLNMFEAYVQAQYQSPEMQELRAHDPSEFLARRDALERDFQQVQRTREQHKQEFEKAQAGFLEEHLRRERQALSQMVPDWSEKHGRAVHDMLTGMHVSQDEYRAVNESARLMVLMHELITLRAEKAQGAAKRASAKGVAERLRRNGVPRTAQPGGGTPNPNRVRAAANARQIKALKKQLKDRGSVRAAADLLNATLRFD